MPGPNELNGRPLPIVTSRARTTRRALVGSIFAAAAGSSVTSWRCNATTPSVATRSSSSARTCGQRPGTSIGSVTLRRYRPVPATKHGTVVARTNLVECLPSGDGVIGDGELVGRVDEVEAVMPHRSLIVDRRLGRADVHPPVDLHRVDGDKFGIGMQTGQRHRHVTLARRCRPEDDEWCSRCHPASTAMRRLCNGSESTSTNWPRR